MTKALALNGAHRVYIIGRRLEKLQIAAKESPLGNIIPIQGDATSKEDLARIAEQVKQEVGYVNLLVCNSGTTGPLVDGLATDPSLAQIQDYMWAWDKAKFDGTYELNNTAVFFTTVAFIGLLDAGNKANNRGGIQSQVLITASIAGLHRQLSASIAYMTSKAAAVHMAKVFATYFGPHGIRFNTLCPGEMTAGLVGATPGFSTMGLPAGRTGTEEDMKGTILYLASRAGAYLNGNSDFSTRRSYWRTNQTIQVS
nr:rhamnolipids biosynthesis 3-oxoacyl-[acyl-carrier-protein] reductase [Quercus suber]